MARLGMEVERVEAAARSLQARASEIDGLINRIDAIVKRVPGLWEGPEAERFVREWWPYERRLLVAASSHIAGLGRAALGNASEQRAASERSGSGGGAGGDSTVREMRLGGDGEVGGQAKHSAADRYSLTRDAGDDGVRIQGVRGEDGVLRYVVYLDGTIPDLLNPTRHRGLLENASLLEFNTETYNYYLDEMRKHIQPPGAEVMIVGYSQGGILAQFLAAQSGFKVTDVMTFGSPYAPFVDSGPNRNIVRIQDVDDPIPKLDPEVVATAWRSIFGDDKGAVDHLVGRYGNPHDQTYTTDTSTESSVGNVGTHTPKSTYIDGGNQYEAQAEKTDAGRKALESQSRFTGQIMSDTDAPVGSDAPVWDSGSNTWTVRY